MTGPDEPQYPDDAGPGGSYGEAPQPVPAYPAYPVAPERLPGRSGLSARIGERQRQRPVPHVGVSLAGLGVGLAIVGIVVWGSSYVVDAASGHLFGGGAGGSRQLLGAVLAFATVVAGYVLVVRARSGPLITAGVVASAVGVPVTIAFLTFDLATFPGSGSPFDVDAVVWVSVVVWLLTYFFVPGARGHTFYLGATILLLWDYTVAKTAAGGLTALAGRAPEILTGGSGPDLGTGGVAAVSLLFGATYYVIAWRLDRSARPGIGVAFVAVGFPAVAVGVGALAPSFGPAGTGVVLLLVGLLLCGYGARSGRRFTTWAWALGAAAGGVLVVSRIASHGGASIGISLIVLGAVFVVAAWAAAQWLGEADELERPMVSDAAG